MQTVSLGHNPNGRWEFDEAVTGCFEDMLRRSIPQYDVMRRACFDIASRYLSPGAVVVDLGCSRGDAIAALSAAHAARFIGVEVSEPMLEAARDRFAGECLVDIRRMDLRSEYPSEQADVTLCILTLQFTPIEYRQGIVRSIYQHTRPGGACILVEKILGASASIDALMVETYYALKSGNGYGPEEIERKRHSLEGVLVPVTARWNEDLLRGAGFQQIDCFWRWMNFAGWIGTRD